ncbi:MAG: 16S rRNA (cytidine(1402)-2'-O)-methyltransferase, partial [Oscillospiraceae bacterium]|nr:16S rRNA (cytidine(1402)-2'-O)-methyltransferase [Oscillospiraceae bacterium]
MDEELELALEPEIEIEEGTEQVRGSGTLYIVATPIGNSRDMSPRGRQILEEADLIAAEDTRRSMVLLNKLGIRNKLVSNHKFNEYGKAKHFITQLQEGGSIAVITDAGTPCISDPGNELIKAAVEAGIRVVGVPGCCAAVNALAISGFDLSSFTFFGFFPRENAERRKLLEKLRRGDTRTFALYESPKRIMDLVDFFIAEQADVRLCLCNDMTKLHEMSFRGTPAEVKEQLLTKGNYDKGEYAIVLEVGKDYVFNKVEHAVSPEAMLVDAMVKGLSPKEAVAAVLADENNSYSK